MMTSAVTTTSKPSRRRAWSRGILAGPMCFIVSAVVMAGAALWYPEGAAHINNIVVPIAVYPAIWAVLFFYLMLDRNLGRAWGVAVVLLLVHSAMIGHNFYKVEAAKKTQAAAVHAEPAR